MATSDVLTVERDDHVATLWLDSAERRNAMGPAFFTGMGLQDQLATELYVPIQPVNGA